jgi:DNA replication and repair protein RecF
MSLRQISLNNFRNIQPVTLDFHSKHNIIYGANASGKTSLLEAINFLCQARSFKTHQTDQCINHNKKDFLLFGQFNNYKVGYSRINHLSKIRLDNETIHKISIVAKKTPVRLIDSSSFDLLTGSPKFRREFLDWYLFHVEHSYQKLWSEHRHALKQRNALLKQKKNINQLDYWDELLSGYCEKIYSLRKKHINEIVSVINDELSHLISELKITLEYRPGWDISSDLNEQFKAKRERDLKYGFTSLGSHRDDMNIFADKLPVIQTLSRGQLKRVSMTLILAQLFLMSKISHANPILLIDDLYSELDEKNIITVVKFLEQLDLQLFITNINPAPELLRQFQEYRLFHVEHGMIKPVRNC